MTVTGSAGKALENEVLIARDPEEFMRRRLYDWYAEHGRQHPWKGTRDPYKIWISEVVLQQTRVAQGSSYYERLVDRFPDVHSLASASEDALFALWKGLGYYNRARNLHRAAKLIVEVYGGVFPESYEQIISLPGVGPYTAAAISSFAFGLPHPVIDGNVKRVLSRLYGIEISIDSTAGQREIERCAELLFDSERPALFNQAIMDFGAILCTPGDPGCHHCPLSSHCSAFAAGRQAVLPQRSRRAPRRTRFFHFCHIISGPFVVFMKREERDIWRGLYQFPMLETNKPELDPEALQREVEDIIGGGIRAIDAPVVRMRQLLSHQEIEARFYRFELIAAESYLNHSVELVNTQNLSNFAVPKVVDWYLSQNSVS